MKEYFKKNFIKMVISVMFLVVLTSVYAQSERIDVKLVEYRADSGYSRIGVVNLFSQDLNEVKISIDNSPEFPVVGLLKSGGTVYKVMNVPAGSHVIKITSNEGLGAESELLFAQSKEGVIESKEQEKSGLEAELNRTRELERLAEENALRTQVEAEVEADKAVSFGVLEKESGSTGLILALIGGLVVIGVVVWLIKRQNEGNV